MRQLHIYWIITGLMVAWLAVGGAMDIARSNQMQEIMRTGGLTFWALLY